MKDIFGVLDETLIDNVFQPSTEKMQMIFGFDLFKIIHILSFACLFGDFFVAYSFLSLSAFWFFLFFITSILSFGRKRLNIFILKKWLSKDSDNPVMNPMRIIGFRSRIVHIFLFFLWLSLLMVVSPSHILIPISNMIAEALEFIFDHFSCCNPVPPSKSKIRQLIESFKEKLEGVFSPEPCPVPLRCESYCEYNTNCN